MSTADGPGAGGGAAADDVVMLSADDVQRVVFEDLADGIVVLDPDFVYRLVTPAAERMLGRAADELVGRSYLELFPEAPDSAFEQACRRVMATSTAETLDEYYEPWDRWYRSRIHRCRLGVVVQFQDVTEARRLGSGRLQPADVLHQLVAHADAIIVVKDLDGRYLFANDAAARNAGRTPAEMLGRTTTELLGPGIGGVTRGHELTVQRLRRAVQVEEHYEEAPAGSPTYLSVRFPVYTATGDLAGTGAIHTDITGWKQAQSQLEASERRFRDVFAATSLGHLVVDPAADVVVEANPAAVALLGRPAAELLGASARRLLPGPDAWRSHDDPHHDPSPDAPAGYEVETEAERPDGTRVPVLATVSSLTGTGLVSCILRDLTPLRDLQARLVDAERLEAVGAVAGGIAHDVNNILAAVGGYADLLEGVLADRPGAAPQVAGIQRSVERAADLVDRLLAFARRQELEPTLFDLGRTATDLADMCRRLLPERVHLDVRADPGVEVRADRSQVQQVLLNLVVNARDAMPDGGRVTLAVDTTDLRTVGGTDLPPGRYARAQVSDVGPGMSEEVLRRCFEPFFTTRRGRGGHGLGLSTAYGIARQSGGDLRVASRPGEGTTFTLLLPVAPAAHPAGHQQPDQRAPARPVPDQQPGGTPAAAPGPGPAGRRQVVLVVDDDPDVRDVAAQTLRRAGHDVETAADGEEALRVAGTLGDRLQAVVSDVHMPGVDGLALVRTLRAGAPTLPVLLVSAAVPDPAPPDVAFLAKPFRGRALADALAALLPGGTP